MKRNSCTSALSRRKSEVDVRTKLRRNSASKLPNNISVQKIGSKPTTENRKDETFSLLKMKLNNFMNENAHILTAKTFKDFVRKKPSMNNISKRKSIIKKE